MIILSFLFSFIRHKEYYDYFIFLCSVLLDRRNTMIILSFLFSFTRHEEYYDYFIFLVQFY